MNTEDDGFNDIFGPIPKNLPTPESKSFMDEIAGYANKNKSFTQVLAGDYTPTSKDEQIANMQGAPVAQNIAEHISEGVKHPVETLKGFIKGIPGNAAQVTKLAELPGKVVMNTLADATGLERPQGLDFAPVEELTAPSNTAQETGYFGAGIVPAEKAITASKPLVKAGVEALSGVSKGIAEAEGTQALKAVANKVKGTVGKTPEIGLSKTPDEILATPSSEAHKLNSAERAFYKDAQKEKLSKQFEKSKTMTEKEYKAKQDQIDAEYNAVEAKTKSELASKVAQSEKEIADINKEIETVAYNKTIELKPKARQVFTNQSNMYKQLIEEDLAPFKNTPVTAQEISDVIKNALPDDPAMAEKLLAQAGKSKNVGELYESIKGVKSGISKGGKSGRTVLTREDMQRDDVAAGLSELLKEKGVDLSRANDFWKQWKPIQQKINLKLKPYDFADMETKTFSEILKKSGNNIYDENFIKEFENVLGEPITTETKAVLSKLSDAEAKKFATQLDAENALSEAKLAKKYKLETASGEKTASLESIKSAEELAKEQLKQDQFMIERLAMRKENIRKVLKAIGYTIGAPAVGIPVYQAVSGN